VIKAAADRLASAIAATFRKVRLHLAHGCRPAGDKFAPIFNDFSPKLCSKAAPWRSIRASRKRGTQSGLGARHAP
jgi:hypothetical protein